MHILPHSVGSFDRKHTGLNFQIKSRQEDTIVITMGAILCSILIRVPRSPLCVTKYNIPLPKKIHTVLNDKETAGKEVIVVGDVHGCLTELENLVNVTKRRYGPYCLYVFVGDIINKGPYNIETLRFVRQLDHFCVRGNHEDWVIKDWFEVKTGKKNIYSEQWMNELTDDDMEYLINLPYTISIPSLKVLVVHAGVSPWKPLNHQLPVHMVTMRNIIGIDEMDPKESEQIEEGIPWGSLWLGPQHVYFGHDARRKLQKHPYATGLDTGCLYGGCLTCINVSRPSEELISVKAVAVHQIPGSKRKS